MTVVCAIDHRFEDLTLERGTLGAGVEVRDARGLGLDACADADGILVGARLRLDAAALAALPRCRAIVRYGVGVDNVDVEAAAAAGIWVAFVPDYCIEEVADHALAMLLALNRRLVALDATVREGSWGVPAGLPVHRLSECTLGVVGFGRIGEALGRRGAALGMTVLAADPVRPAAEIVAAGAEPVALDELVARADYVSLHAPPARDGGAVLSAERIATMKPGACVVNVARGGLVDEPALIAALASGALGGAALDVAAAEPLTPPNPLLEAPNVLVSPHAAWYSIEAVRELRTKAAAEVGRVLAGGEPRFAANRPVA
ncbi:C-terminal binding protein [Solirubrobacter ginsenosidimutans]|uniref:C-terminal binding protein n=1 Tax=Solirubrobacter ginsenosidimutans TaxID=490573 RepID=A0A9X3MML3_9ACTN|nr:C-terminal binding protein [Solirubrobacter ginsenosidimutans]MDA0159244.1 C-terminal binding protein [Solirubrobacter ginsenosidimutans]